MDLNERTPAPIIVWLRRDLRPRTIPPSSRRRRGTGHSSVHSQDDQVSAGRNREMVARDEPRAFAGAPAGSAATCPPAGESIAVILPPCSHGDRRTTAHLQPQLRAGDLRRTPRCTRRMREPGSRVVECPANRLHEPWSRKPAGAALPRLHAVLAQAAGGIIARRGVAGTTDWSAEAWPRATRYPRWFRPDPWADGMAAH